VDLDRGVRAPMDFLLKSGRWVRALGQWLQQAWRVWGPLVVVPAILALSHLIPAKLEDRLRYCGLVLELLGIATVVLGIIGKRKLFKKPTLREHIRAWFDGRPRWGRRQQAILTATGSLGIASGAAKLSMWRGIPPNASLEDRVAAVEQNLSTLRTELANAEKEIQNEARQRTESIAAERRARETAMSEMQAQLEGMGAESLHVEMTGVFWLVVGVVLDTISAELAWVFTSLLGWWR